MTSLGLAVAQWLAPSSLLADVIAITVANLVAAVFRFAVLRAWIFRPSARAPLAVVPTVSAETVGYLTPTSTEELR